MKHGFRVTGDLKIFGEKMYYVLYESKAYTTYLACVLLKN